MKKIYLLLFGLIHHVGFGQTGTLADPYTQLAHAWWASSSGTYYFNIGGTAFSTYVEASTGWVLIASSNAATTGATNYAAVTALTLQSDNILPASIYASASITEVRINATSGPALPFDVKSSSSSVLTNLRNDVTLSVSTNSGDWSGTGTSRLSQSCAVSSVTLRSSIYHACGNGTGLHWMSSSNYEHIEFSNASRNDLNLWVRAGSGPLPINLRLFEVKSDSPGSIRIFWESLSENNKTLYIVEKSTDASHWEPLDSIYATSDPMHQYEVLDYDSYQGKLYYRIKQIDPEEMVSYSDIQYVEATATTKVSTLILYPNPVESVVNLTGSEAGELKILNYMGQEIPVKTMATGINQETISIDVSQLQKGAYIVKKGTIFGTFYKQ